VVSESERIKRRTKCRNMPRYSEDSVFPAGAEKCPTLYGRVMLPKPAFNIRRGGGEGGGGGGDGGPGCVAEEGRT
jgi:hypothetical protein